MTNNNSFKINLTSKVPFRILSFLLLLVFVTSCEDIIDVELEEDEAQLVVDAWINDKSETQVIKLRRTSPYFDSTPSPAVTGATVAVAIVNDLTDIDTIYFTDDNNDGNYTWTPAAGETFGVVGKTHVLGIELDGDQYFSVSEMTRPTPIDSIGYEYEEESLGSPEGIYAQVYATDPIGMGDASWIKSFKNNQFLNKAQELNIAFDGGFGPSEENDGILFLPPIRELINRIPDFGDDAIDDGDIPPWAVGDTVRVETHSLTPEAFYYLFELKLQMTSGDAGIFSTPITNVPTNIFPTEDGAKENPIGFFCVSSVSVKEREIE